MVETPIPLSARKSILLTQNASIFHLLSCVGKTTTYLPGRNTEVGRGRMYHISSSLTPPHPTPNTVVPSALYLSHPPPPSLLATNLSPPHMTDGRTATTLAFFPANPRFMCRSHAISMAQKEVKRNAHTRKLLLPPSPKQCRRYGAFC